MRPEDLRHTERLRAITRIMDEAVRVPGTRLRFGLDGILGMVPGVGDAVTAAIAGYALLAAARMGAPKSVIARMAGNIVTDAAVGAVPLLGDLFDFAFKANRRNLRLLEQFAAEPVRTRKASRIGVAATIGVIGFIVVAVAFLTVWIVRTALQAVF